ncbi:formylglycine-generating enzyme family protein [Noviherbaspirillum sp. ST9]|uniref:formylglycine-generating enzyme family protein n=1 Tax=Noviherbaspirillum sp. ST9 TaxID=3401606 RepID=UPI003B58B105
MKHYFWLILCAASAVQAAPANWQEPATGMAFVSVAKGCFQMGTEQHVPLKPNVFWERIRHDAPLSEDEGPRHEVCVDAFWMGKLEVRTGEWQKVMDGEPPANPGLPVASVTLTQAREFAERLTKLSEGKERFRLPTEAEWEYACRAGAKSEELAIGGELAGQAWYGVRGSYRPQPSETGKLAANAFGLHDMLGNVWEWTEDSYLPDGYARHALYNPKVSAATPQQVIRGGAFRTEPRQMRCAMRSHYDAAQHLDSIGFRLVREASADKTAKTKKP